MSGVLPEPIIDIVDRHVKPSNAIERVHRESADTIVSRSYILSILDFAVGARAHVTDLDLPKAGHRQRRTLIGSHRGEEALLLFGHTLLFICLADKKTFFLHRIAVSCR